MTRLSLDSMFHHLQMYSLIHLDLISLSLISLSLSLSLLLFLSLLKMGVEIKIINARNLSFSLPKSFQNIPKFVWVSFFLFQKIFKI